MYVNSGMNGFREEMIGRMSANIAAGTNISAGFNPQQIAPNGLPSANDVNGSTSKIPKWMFVGGGVALTALVLWLTLRKKKEA